MVWIILKNRDTYFAETQKQWFCENRICAGFCWGGKKRLQTEALVYPDTEIIPSCVHF